MFIKENWAGLFHQTNRRMTLKPGLVHGVFRGSTFIVITFNQELNLTCQKQGHSLYHSSILMSSGGRIRHWMCCWRVA